MLSSHLWPRTVLFWLRTTLRAFPVQENYTVGSGRAITNYGALSCVADWIRELAMKKGAWAKIPPKGNRSDPICFSPYLYRARNRVEQF
jgi:hypothetical protein